MKRFSVAILHLLACIVAGASTPISCPSAEDLAPCTCKRMAYGLHVVCANFIDDTDLARAFKALRDYTIQNVLLHGIVLPKTLPSDLFNGTEIHRLRIENSKLMFSVPAFTGLEEFLQELDVRRSTVKCSEDNSIAKLGKLTELTLKSIPLGKVTDDWLNEKVPNIQYIVLEEDGIDEIENEAFLRLRYLKKISLSDNKIKGVQRSMFSRPAQDLREMDFSYNQIEMLPYDIFFDMPALTDVVLSGNHLTTLTDRTWSPVWEQLQTVLVFENSLVCDDDLNWMRKKKWPYRVQGHCIAPSHRVGKALAEVYKA